MIWTRSKQGRELEGLVYQVAGPGGEGDVGIARTVTGQIAHGRTLEAAVERLRACVEALASAAGVSPQEWRRSQRTTKRVHFLRRRELLQA